MKITPYIFHLLILSTITIFISCSGDAGEKLLGPDYGQAVEWPETEIVTSAELNLTLTLKEKNPQSVMLSAANDDTTSDSLHLYIDVEIANAGENFIYLPSDVKSFSINAQVSFVDFPYNSQVSRGVMDIVIGKTNTGFEITERLETAFSSGNPLSYNLPITRVDSFRVADNVAVWGNVVSEGLFVEADSIVVLAPGADPSILHNPDLLGFVDTVFVKNNRLYLSKGIAAIDEYTKIMDMNGNLRALGSLNDGRNAFTITALAWAYSYDLGLVANGWEFRDFPLKVARQP